MEKIPVGGKEGVDSSSTGGLIKWGTLTRLLISETKRGGKEATNWNCQTWQGNAQIDGQGAYGRGERGEIKHLRVRDISKKLGNDREQQR